MVTDIEVLTIPLQYSYGYEYVRIDIHCLYIYIHAYEFVVWDMMSIRWLWVYEQDMDLTIMNEYDRSSTPKWCEHCDWLYGPYRWL